MPWRSGVVYIAGTSLPAEIRVVPSNPACVKGVSAYNNKNLTILLSLISRNRADEQTASFVDVVAIIPNCETSEG
jgi:hypothetical protein